MFYFRPGHEAYPTYHDTNVERVLANAVQWAAPTVNLTDAAPTRAPLERLGDKGQGFARAGVVQDAEDLG